MLEDHVGAFHDLLDALDLLHARVDVLEDHGDVLYDVLDTLVHVPATCHLPPATCHGRRRRLADFAPYLRRRPPSRCWGRRTRRIRRPSRAPSSKTVTTWASTTSSGRCARGRLTRRPRPASCSARHRQRRCHRNRRPHSRCPLARCALARWRATRAPTYGCTLPAACASTLGTRRRHTHRAAAALHTRTHAAAAPVVQYQDAAAGTDSFPGRPEGKGRGGGEASDKDAPASPSRHLPWPNRLNQFARSGTKASHSTRLYHERATPAPRATWTCARAPRTRPPCGPCRRHSALAAHCSPLHARRSVNALPGARRAQSQRQHTSRQRTARATSAAATVSAAVPHGAGLPARRQRHCQ